MSKTCNSHNKKPGPDRSPIRKVAEEAGMTRHQMYQAIAASDIPEDEFERLIESDNPPSLSELAAIGRGKEKPKLAPRRHTCPHCGGDLTN